LPLSLKLVGRLNEKATLIRAAHAYEQATHWHMLIRPTEEMDFQS
jgi:Asp-tRNA(Asn)/Glu-tRNA(Gln) amidotransferase A subunit family amidase